MATSTWNRAAKTRNAPVFFSPTLPSRLIWTAVKSKYIAEHKEVLTFSSVLEDGPLLGTKNVAGGLLPDIYLVPAVHDLSDEIKVKSTTSFGRIVQRALQEMASQSTVYVELKTRLDELVNTLNLRAGNRARPSQLEQIETLLAAELQDWKVKVQIEVNA